MSEPHRRPRRLGPIFAASLGLHACVLYAISRDTVRPFAAIYDDTARVTPVSFVSRPPRPRSDAPPRKRRATATRPAAVIASPAEVAAVAAPAVRLAQSLGPASPLAPSGLPDAAAITAGDSAAPAVLADGGQAGRYPINPGYWEVVLHWLLIDRTERYCVEPQNIARFMAVPCNHIYTCSAPTEVFEGDRFRFEEVVTGRHERFDVRGHGAYSPDSLRVSARIAGHYKILPVVILGSLDGRFLGPDCPADAKRIRQR